MRAPVLSADAHEARSAINRTFAAHQEVLSSLSARKTRRRLRSSGVDSVQLQRQATIIRMMSIVESFSGERLFVEAEQLVDPTRHATVADMWDKAFEAATKSWHSRRETFHDWLGVERSLWPPIEDLAEARNAVAHASGRLTHKQRKQNSKNPTALANKFRGLDIDLDSDQLVLTEQSILTAGGVCIALIEGLDHSLRTRPSPPLNDVTTAP